MKDNIHFPAEKIVWFKEKLGIEKTEFELLEDFRHLFTGKKAEFSSYFFDYFSKIDETAFLLKHQKHGQHLSRIWENWFESFFKEHFSDRFLKALWMSGLTHVEISIDHRFITLSYSVLRQFCQKIVRQELPERDHEPVLTIIDKMVDLCLLIETNAFVEGTSRCDMEVVRGISHQVRNPLTVIGGNAMRLIRNSGKTPDQKDIPEICNTIIEESRRLERMVTDASAYSDMYQKEAIHSIVQLDTLVSGAIDRLTEEERQLLTVSKNIFPGDLKIHGDKDDLEIMFSRIIKHCIDSAPDGKPEIIISAEYKNHESSFVEIEILNKGFFQNPEELQKNFTPFYSSQPDGTGFGLSIAKLAAQKSLGDMVSEEAPGEGIRYIVRLPVPAADK